MPADTLNTEEFAVWPVGKTHFRHESEILELPRGWIVVPPGDSALTRRIKASGEYWVIMGLYKKRAVKHGLCAPKITVEKITSELEQERANPSYQKRLEAGKKYREVKQQAYVEDFEQEVLKFLHFHERYRDIAVKLARAVTEHATPVGSGTVARTQRIPVDKRAEAAVIAWMRHQTTAYDHMHISRFLDDRREIRRELAIESRKLLEHYRAGGDIDLSTCPLAQALMAQK